MYKNTRAFVRSPDGDTEFFDIIAGVLQEDTLAPYLFIIVLDYVLRNLDQNKNLGFTFSWFIHDCHQNQIHCSKY